MCGISLLEAVGYVVDILVFDRLTKWICQRVMSEKQCILRSGTGTRDILLPVG